MFRHFHIIIRPKDSVENYAPKGMFEALIQGLEETGWVHVYSNWQSVPDPMQFMPQRDVIFFWGFDDLSSHAILHEAINLGIPCVEINHSWFDCVRGQQFRFTLLQGQGLAPCIAPVNNTNAYALGRLRKLGFQEIRERTTENVQKVLLIPTVGGVSRFLGSSPEEVQEKMWQQARSDYPYLPESAFHERKVREVSSAAEALATHQAVYVYNSGMFVEAFMMGCFVHPIDAKASLLPKWRYTFGRMRNRTKLLGFLAQQQGSLAEMATPSFVLNIIERQAQYGDVMLAE